MKSRDVQTLTSYRCSSITPLLIRLGSNRQVECRLHGHAVLRIFKFVPGETLMLHIQVPVSRITCMYPCLLLQVLAEYDLQLCACSKKRLLCACVPVRLARGYTPRLHLMGRGGEGGVVSGLWCMAQ